MGLRLPAKLSSSSRAVEHIATQYGDLLFDFCESILWSTNNAQIAFRSVMRAIRAAYPGNEYQEYERAFVLRVACEKLRVLSDKYGRRLTPAERIMLDASLDVEARIKQFDSYFHRLATEDQMVLLLRDKYGLSYTEIAAAMGVPEGSLKVRRAQALRTLEEWIWDEV